MGLVYAAYDPRLDRRVALKILNPRSMQAVTEGARRRLLREAQAMARLSDPNVVNVYDAGEVGGEVFLAMEFVEGKTLRAWLDERPRTWREILPVFISAGRGLAAAHAAGIVHRDFKPENVLVQADGRARVTDFGIAKSVLEPAAQPCAAPVSEDAIATHTAGIVGTPAYMAPEQYSAGLPIDSRTDQYCFCVALYEALFGARPFTGETLVAVAFAKSMGRIRPLPEAPRVPAWLRRAVLHGLEADPAKRYPSMDVLLAALGRNPASTYAIRVAAVASIVLLAAAVAAWRVRTERQCRVPAGKFAGIWDQSRKENVRRAFLATGLSYAQDTWRVLVGVLDGYVAGWAEMYQDACEATRRRGEQSIALLDLRMACLDQRRRELGSFVQLLTEASAKTVEQAVQAAHARESLSACGDARALTERARHGGQGATAHEIGEVRARVGRVTALTDLGRYKDAYASGEEAVKAARRTGDPFVLAEALLALGQAYRRGGDPRRAELLLIEGIEAALASNDDEAFARAATVLSAVTGVAAFRREEGHRWSRFARASIIALGPGHESVEVDRLCTESRIYREEARFQEAGQIARDCLALATSALPGGDLRVAEANRQVAIVAESLGRYQEAADYYHRAAVIIERALGPGHPELAEVLSSEGGTRADFGDPGGLPLVRRAREIEIAATGADSPSTANRDYNLGRALMRAGQLAEARALLEHAQRVFERTDPNSWRHLATLYRLAECHYREGDLDGSLVRVRHVLAVAEPLVPPDYPDLAWPLLLEGEILMAQHSPGRAIPLLERSAALRDAGRVAPELRGASTFGLARALWQAGRDRARACELAVRALGLYREQPKGFEAQVAEIEAWIARHPAQGLEGTRFSGDSSH